MFVYIFIKLAIFTIFLLSSTVMFFSLLHVKHFEIGKIFCKIDESVAP